MTKQEAIAAVGPVAAHHEGVTNFFVTTDGTVHTNAELAVAKAVELSPGNPTVIDVSINELELDKAAADKAAADKAAADKAAADKAAADKAAADKAAADKAAADKAAADKK